MSRPWELQLYDRDDEPDATQPELSQDLASGAGTVRASIGGNIIAVELDPKRLQVITPTALAAQLTEAIQQVQRRAADLRPSRRKRR